MVGSATHYRLGYPRFESWWIQNIFPFSIPVQTNPGAHPVSRTMSAEALSCGWRAGELALTAHCHLATRLNISRAIPVLSQFVKKWPSHLSLNSPWQRCKIVTEFVLFWIIYNVHLNKTDNMNCKTINGMCNLTLSTSSILRFVNRKMAVGIAQSV